MINRISPFFAASIPILVIFNERFPLLISSGGRGVIPFLLLFAAAILFLYELFCKFNTVKSVLLSNRFILGGGIYIFLSFILPIIGVVIFSLPTRLLMDSVLKLSPLAYIVFGAIIISDAKLFNIFLRSTFISICIVLVFSSIQYVEYRFGAGISSLPIIAQIRAWDFASQVRYSDGYLVAGRSIGTFINPNVLGFFGVAIYCIYRLYHKGAAIVVIFSSLFITILSQSRGSIIALMCVIASDLIFVLIKAHQNKAIKIGHIMLFASFPIAIITVLLLGINFDIQEASLDRFSGISSVLEQGASGDSSLSGRVSTWTDSLNYLMSQPLGTFGPPLLVSGLSADNQYVYSALQGSIVFLASFIMLIVFRILDIKSQIHLVSALISIGIAVNSITALPMDSSVIIIVWMLFGCSAIIQNDNGPDPINKGV